MIGTAVLDAERAPAELDLASAPRWHVLVLVEGRPAARVDLSSPGAVSGGALAAAALLRRADAERARDALIARLRMRLGAGPPPAPAPLRVSVVVCTHRRGHYLPDLLAGIARLDPAPFEVIVVDNDPGEEDCRELVERLGMRYLREDRRGLDNARNAGLHAACGDVVMFTDDDCVPSVGWLAPLARAFAHPAVAVVTGPAFPYVLDTPARIRMEAQASLARGLQRVAFDWQTISPLHAAAMGVGANMAFRRERLLALGAEPFPPELDAGTESESGGDTYVLSRLLAAGERVIYEPELFTFHQHRPDPEALHRALRGYGIGLSAALAKLLVEERELSAPRAWAWLVSQYLRTQRRRAVGRADAVETRLSWDYLEGGFRGAARWRAALRTQAAWAPAAAHAATNGGAPAPSPVMAAAPADAAPELTVVVPTFRRERALRRCLDALARQDAPPGSFDVVVVDDDPDAVETETAPGRFPFPLRRVRSGGAGGAAGARNRGAREAAAPLLLFLDDDVVADPWLVRRHLEWHAAHGGRAALVGPYRPRPVREGFAASVARLWWQDVFALMEEARGATFVSALTANLSLPRAVFEEVGGFDEAFSRQRREDWEWGLRMLDAGVAIAYDREASARHEFTLTTEQRLRDARREGVGDTVIAARWPQALPSLPLHQHRPPGAREPLRRLAFAAWRLPTTRRAVLAGLGLLERGRLRDAWLRLFRLAQTAAYAHGVHEGGWRAGSAPPEAAVPPLDVELLSDEPLPPPRLAAPLVRVTLRGEELARVAPHEGVWGPALAEQLVDAIPPEAVARAVEWGAWMPEQSERHGHAREVEVLLGPANPPSDLAHRAALEEAGAVVRALDGDPARHWEAIAAAVREGDRPLVAIPLPGTAPGPAWLTEALSAFDGERVGAAFGGVVAAEDPAEPLFLHDAQSADAALALTGPPPAYLVLRRELALALAPTGDLLGPVLAAVERALAGGWVLGHRHVRGLQAPAQGVRELGEAYGRAQARALDRVHGGDRTRAVARGTARGVLTLGWTALRGHGRLTASQRALAGGIARGALGRSKEPPDA